ncbi:ATP-binding cassette domain-containing protein [Streptomyces sp. CA-243310]|uniref:ATP-binding cassette domain-containing protein n=1 Tax=Streptomyces sp. CA-243310 TaxID=3240056 RepID=UPI003D8C6EC5
MNREPNRNEIRELAKDYGITRAVDHLTFDVLTGDVLPGRVTGFLVPSGAGKSTDRAPAARARPTHGRHRHHRRDPVRPPERPAAPGRRSTGSAGSHGGCTARNHLLALAVSNGIAAAQVNTVLERAGLAVVARQPVKTFSPCIRRRLGMAPALLGDSGVVLLAEPTNALDREGILRIRELMRSLAADGRAALVSSHLMAETASFVDHLVAAGQGALLADLSMKGFIDSRSTPRARLRTSDPDRLRAAPARRGFEPANAADRCWAVDGIHTEQIGSLAAREGYSCPNSPLSGPPWDRPVWSSRPPAPSSGRPPSEARPPPKPSLMESGTHVMTAVALPSISVLHSEWIKIRSSRMAFGSLTAVFLVTTGITALIAAAIGTAEAGAMGDDRLLGAFHEVNFGQMAAIALGTTVFARELRNGAPRVSLTAVPHRTRLYLSKVAMIARLGFISGQITGAVTFVAGQAFMVKYGWGLGDTGVLRAVFRERGPPDAHGAPRGRTDRAGARWHARDETARTLHADPAFRGRSGGGKGGAVRVGPCRSDGHAGDDGRLIRSLDRLGGGHALVAAGPDRRPARGEPSGSMTSGQLSVPPVILTA